MNPARKICAAFLCLAVCLTALIPGAPRAFAESENRTVEIEVGDTVTLGDGSTRGMTSPMPDLSLRPGSALHYVDKVRNMYGVGLNGVDHTDTPYIPSEQFPYTLVGNGLCSRIMVMMDAPIPKSVHPDDDLTDPEVRKRRSCDLTGQYKLKDQYGDVYYTYCCDVATDANLHDTYNGRNLEEADHFNESDASHIRYICLNGYWGTAEGFGSLAAFTDMLVGAGVLTSEEAAAVTPGEAMTAMQAAIWTFGNREFSFSVDGSVVTGPALKTYYFSSMDFDWQEEYIASGNIIKKMYDYLVAGTLEPTPRTTIITKLDAFADVQLTVGDRISGGAGSSVFDTDLAVTLGDIISETDDLKLAVVQEDTQITEIPLVAGQTEYTLSDLQLQENAEISLRLTGEHPTDTGVYLYEAEDPWVSQSLVGCHEGTQQVGLAKNLTFRVSYQCELEISGDKVLENGQLKEGQFLFQLRDDNGSSPTDDSGPRGSLIEEVRNGADGKFSFSPLVFTSEDLEGEESITLHYIVREVPEDVPGVTYDTTEYAVEVRLYLDGDELKAEIVSPEIGIRFVNSVESTDIPVTKIWNDGNDHDRIRPAKITVRLLADGKSTGEKLVLRESNGWAGTFSGLPVYDAATGSKIVYTVREDEVSGYTAVTKVDADGLVTITNTHDAHEESPVTPPPSDTPDTGDDSPVALWTLLFLGSGAALLVLLLTGRKYRMTF